MKNFHFLILLMLVLAAYSCAPVFSELQSARMVGKGNFEASPHFTTTSAYDEDESGHVQNNYGLQAAYGISDKFDIRARYEYINLADDDGSTNIFGIGPKVSLMKDRIAAFLPVGFAFGGDVEGVDNFELLPTMLFTLPVGKYFEINPSVKSIIVLEDPEFILAFNLGLGLSSNFNKYAIRPEYGICFKPGDEGHYGQFSIGISVYFNKRK
jgi:hypothetical protein